MSKIQLYMKNQKGSSEYNATATYNDGKITILKGSIISSSERTSKNFKISNIAKNYRSNEEYVKEKRVLKDIEFNSLTAAAQFVCGYSVSGQNCWKDKNKKSIKEILGGKYE